MLEGRVKFLSRLGRSSGAGLKVEGDAAAKANVWATLARTAANPVQQLSAYQKCLDCVNGRFERVEYLVELAEWLVAQRASKGDAQTALESAVDLLLEVEGSAPPMTHGTVTGSQYGSHISGTTTRKTTTRASQSSRPGTGHSQRSQTSKRSGTSVHSGSSAGGANRMPGAPKHLGATHYELLVRALAMLAELAMNSTIGDGTCY